MPRPTKFTAERRRKIVEALSVGASRRTAAAIGGIDASQLTRWVERGKDAPEESAWHRFYLEVLEAEAHPRMRALGVVYTELPNRPDLAWKFIERREPGYAPPIAAPSTPTGPVVIQLSLHDAPMPAVMAPALELAPPIEDAEVVDEQDVPAGAAPSDPG